MFQEVSLVLTADDLLKACRVWARASNREIYTRSGKWWFWTGRENTLYNHAQAPNGRIPDCMSGSTLRQRTCVRKRALRGCQRSHG